jgi:hypothetical protein
MNIERKDFELIYSPKNKNGTYVNRILWYFLLFTKHVEGLLKKSWDGGSVRKQRFLNSEYGNINEIAFLGETKAGTDFTFPTTTEFPL